MLGTVAGDVPVCDLSKRIRAGPRHVGAPGRLIRCPLKTMLSKLVRPRTGLESISRGRVPKLRIFLGETV
jgi:hypothetical protein